MSRIDGETTADAEVVRLRRQEEGVALWSSALADRVSCSWIRDLPEPNASGYDSDNFATSAWGLDRIDSVDVASKRVFIRVDFNAPQDKKDPSVITNSQRIDAALPTIQYRLDQGCTSVVLASHLGRSDGSAAEKYSLAPVAKCLEDELKRPLTILKGCAGPSVEAACANPSPGSVILLENVRLHVEEEEKGVDKDGNKFKVRR